MNCAPKKHQKHNNINKSDTTIGKDYHTMEEISLDKNYNMKIKIEATTTQDQNRKWNEKDGEKSTLNFHVKHKNVITNRGKQNA